MAFVCLRTMFSEYVFIKTTKPFQTNRSSFNRNHFVSNSEITWIFSHGLWTLSWRYGSRHSVSTSSRSEHVQASSPPRQKVLSPCEACSSPASECRGRHQYACRVPQSSHRWVNPLHTATYEMTTSFFRKRQDNFTTPYWIGMICFLAWPLCPSDNSCKPLDSHICNSNFSSFSWQNAFELVSSRYKRERKLS